MTNSAAIGYVIKAMELLGYSSRKIKEMETTLNQIMDCVDEEQAEIIYRNS